MTGQDGVESIEVTDTGATITGTNGNVVRITAYGSALYPAPAPAPKAKTSTKKTNPNPNPNKDEAEELQELLASLD